MNMIVLLLGLAVSGSTESCGQVLASCHDETSEGQLVWSTNVYDIVQPFQIDAPSICGVRLLVSISSVESTDLTVRIQSSPEPLDGVLTETTTTITREPAFYWWVDVDLPDVTVNAGQTYFLYVKSAYGMWGAAEQICDLPALLNGRPTLSSAAFEILGGVPSPAANVSWARIKSTFGSVRRGATGESRTN